MKGIVKISAVLLIAVMAYLAAWPVPVDPKVWNAPSSNGFVGPYQSNDRLEDFEALPLAGLSGPEAVTDDGAGNIFATTHEGWILKWAPGATEPEKWVNTKGRPLGIDFDANGNLWVANAYIGLQKITPAKVITVEATETAGVAIRYADDLVVVPDGRIFFSDASTKFSAAEVGDTLSASLLDIMEHGDYGRIIEFEPSTGASKVVMDGMTFANGVTADQGGNFILVAETGSYKVWKYWLKGTRAGQTELLADNLPGFPDNIHRGLNDRYWLGFTTIRTAILDDLSDKPFWRKVVQRMPEFLRPQVQAYGHVIAIDENGQVLESLQDPEGAYPATTGAWETEEHLYVSSLTAPVLARYSKAKLGID